MAFPTTGIIDNFNRANEGPPLSSDWTDVASGFQVVSNTCKPSTLSANILNFWNAATFGPDCEAYVTLTDERVAFMGVVLRVTTLVAGTWDGYRVVANSFDNEIAVFRVDDGVTTQIGDVVSYTWSDGEQLGADVIGSTIRGYVDGVEKISRDDANYADAGFLGLAAFITSSNSIQDDFGGGTIAGAGGIVVLRRRIEAA